MERRRRIYRLTDRDGTAWPRLPLSPSSGFLYAFLLAVTSALSILSVILFR
ncbi:MAG: hypothetical protein IJJ72_01010 [Bacteroidales bacterium]|nr:hypothetical protein [Bacteroidales bacterium]MBR0499559.1 hypothetical protein [Bacteroidales bacterium]